MRKARTPDRVEWPTVALILATYLCFGLLTWFHAAVPWWAFIPLGAYVAGLHGSIQHEVVHGHPTPWRWLNEALIFPCLWLWLPFPYYREAHLCHHEDDHLTCPRLDPESNYVEPEVWDRMAAPGRWLRWVLNTFAGRLLLGPFRSWYWSGRHLVTALRTGNRQWLFVWARHAVAIALPLAWALWICGLPLWLYLVTFMYGGNMLAHIRSFLEHQARPGVGERTVAIEAGPVMGLLFLYNNLHILHHAEPGTAWYRLPGRWQQRRAELLARNGDYRYAGYWQVAWHYFVKPKEPPRHPGWTQGGTLRPLRKPQAETAAPAAY